MFHKRIHDVIKNYTFFLRRNRNKIEKATLSLFFALFGFTNKFVLIIINKILILTSVYWKFIYGVFIFSLIFLFIFRIEWRIPMYPWVITFPAFLACTCFSSANVFIMSWKAWIRKVLVWYTFTFTLLSYEVIPRINFWW